VVEPGQHPPAAGRHRGVERLVVADAAAHLHVDVEAADDLGLELPVVPAPEGSVEVDEVDPLRSGLLPPQRRRHRVTEPLLRPGHPLHELHGLSVGDVDGGKQLEVRRRGHPANPRQRPCLAGASSGSREMLVRRGLRCGG
jgi:hypothetical protein